MIFIAHRGNIKGAQPTFENRYDYIKHAYSICRGVEIDLQTYKDVLYLGHDEPQERVTHNIWKFMQRPNVFCHAKDLDSIHLLLTYGCNTFYHTDEKIVFTSKGHIWCYPGVYHQDITRSIWLDCHNPIPENKKLNCYGICGDNMDKYI